MEEKEKRPMLPRGIAVAMSLLLVPLAMAGIESAIVSMDEYAANFGPSGKQMALAILLPGLLLNGLLAYASRPRREGAGVIPWFLLLLVVTAVGVLGYIVVLLLTHKGDLKVGG